MLLSLFQKYKKYIKRLNQTCYNPKHWLIISKDSGFNVYKYSRSRYLKSVIIMWCFSSSSAFTGIGYFRFVTISFILSCSYPNSLVRRWRILFCFSFTSTNKHFISSSQFFIYSSSFFISWLFAMTVNLAYCCLLFKNSFSTKNVISFSILSCNDIK